jgi:excisionase family DNA binding protein
MLSEPLAVEPLEPTPGKRLLDVREVARVLSCGRTHVYHMIATRELLAVKIGRLTRVPVEAVDEFVARKVREAREGL